ncbi:hydrogenase subunit [Methanoculleus horonobensis]|jgi:hydrogenase-4 component E|uniref:hydrogenase subunit n=1 Tax=Methanoculleus horonobensis TaxID=528314 RepID=UPI0008330B7E|nr:hydrogenase subunit [Methanoculleus horonobensis]
MIETPFVDGIVRFIFVAIVITAVFLISARSLPFLLQTYRMQSLLLAALAVAIFFAEGHTVLLWIAVLTVASKVLVIPYFIGEIQERISIRRDLEFRYLSPASSIMVSIALIVGVYLSLGNILSPVYADAEPLFFFGAVVGISLMLMGMLVLFSRTKAITKVLGYLSMENGVLIFGICVTELPFIMDVMIMIDLIILVLLTTILTVGIDSTIETYEEKIRQYSLWNSLWSTREDAP